MTEVMRRERSGVAGGLILIGIGVLLITGWWWPGTRRPLRPQPQCGAGAGPSRRERAGRPPLRPA